MASNRMARPFVVVLLLSTLPLCFAASARAEESIQPVEVTVARVSERELPAPIEVAGTVQAAERAAIAAKITGTIADIPVVLGSAVKAGQLLVAINAGEIAARLNQAEALLNQARRNLEREQNLLAKHASTPETVKSMADQFAMAQAGYREAKTMLGYTAITAPFDGVVTGKNAQVGDLATPGTVLLQVENLRTLQVRSAVPESLVQGIHPGDVLTVQVEAAGTSGRATVAEVAPAVDPQSRTASVILNLPPDPGLRPGQFARLFVAGPNVRALLVPESAVVPSGQLDRVFAVADGRASLRLVRTGIRRDGMVEILSGLDGGETVATDNNRLLVDGQPLQVRP
ncbi:MAG: efflux RND transporter periplasmic adaptor subunit [Desulfobulbus sp.]|jgi:RND family efflux transporter MFP subunit|uniref:efflux RND transporter periplasmic adaptor subunit n=1 Tax=Desulfobulbus sp. TaxID=895 RepID=UPI0028482930|nr:efflux RND transporter periplasmic adaptor subunit [Desulfobulbus sp.]MDR2550081.1 efflux RND transporter periplasmic adaptor subunit [Desulfobulbus sp.]